MPGCGNLTGHDPAEANIAALVIRQVAAELSDTTAIAYQVAANT